MNDWFNRLNWLLQLLVQGVRVDLAYSIVVILVITSLFSTPLILGSIKNRVYVAVKAQVEKENNAREITIQQADAEVQHNLDNEFLTKLRSKYPNFQIVGNLKSVVMIEGPVGSQVKTLQTLVPDDPRTEALQIKPKISSDFGLFDVVISNDLCKLLYGTIETEKSNTQEISVFDKLWLFIFTSFGYVPQEEKQAVKKTEICRFAGESLKLSINDIPLKGQFQVVARQTTPGRKIYASEQLGIALKRYSIGLGAEELELPIVSDLIQYSLPSFETMHCILDFPKEECNKKEECGKEKCDSAQEKIIKRLKAEDFLVEASQPMVAEINRFQVTLTQFDDINGRVEPTKGDCEKRLYHHLQVCPSAIVTPQISLEINLAHEHYSTIQLAGITSRSYDWLPGIEEMRNQQGGKMLDFGTEGLSKRGIEMVAPYNANLPLNSVVYLQMGESPIPAVVTAYYQCPESMDCPFYTTPLMVFRLQNIIDGAAIFKHGKEEGELPIFYPTPQQQRIDYDEILFYANQVEEVEELYEELKKALPGYRVEYNIYAIDKLKRQDQRLSTLFNLTVFLSILFIVLAVGALAKINVDKRRRQMAQLFILGYSKSFVSVLLVCEYMLLTMLASIASIGVGSWVFAVARYFLQSSAPSTTDFATIINAMTLDLGAFAMVFIIVVSLTTLVAGYAAYYASKSDPIELLD